MLDRVKIFAQAGRGGHGLVSFRREKFVPKGGPDGGDGGKGGDIILKASSSYRTLDCLRGKRRFRASNGQGGGKNNKTGQDAQNLIIKVPLGTQIIEKEKLLCDLSRNNQEYILARGGKGGWGNKRFATSTNQAPRFARKGQLGQQKQVVLNLKKIADVGLIGMPNAGKSSLLALASRASPKIAAYPFTTTEPNFGVVRHKGKSFIIADIPGLIEGASRGRGLGFKFLQHIERCKIVVHMIDGSAKNISKTYQNIRLELEKFNPKLARKPEIIVLNKIDLLEKKPKFRNALLVSCQARQGINKLLDKIIENLSQNDY